MRGWFVRFPARLAGEDRWVACSRFVSMIYEGQRSSTWPRIFVAMWSGKGLKNHAHETWACHPVTLAGRCRPQDAISQLGVKFGIRPT
jgi:hypothetical protein